PLEQWLRVRDHLFFRGCAMKNALDAVKLLQDWSKWLVGLDSAALASIAALGVSGHETAWALTKPTSAIAAASAAMLFVLSLFCANRLLLSLPGVAQRTDEASGEDILMQGTFNGVGWRVSFFARAQNHLFLAGMLAMIGW